MKIDQLKPDKLERTTPSSAATGRERVTAIVKVRIPNYVPSGLQVRSRIDEHLFTAEGTQADFDAAAKDPNVETISSARKLRLIP